MARSEGPDLERLALRWLAARPLTEAELAGRLRRRGVAEAALTSLLARLRRAGYLDDARLARDYLVRRGDRPGRAPERSAAELVRRGVAAERVEAARAAAERDGELDGRAILERRLARALAAAGGRLDRRALARVYTSLLRAGFDAETVREALEPHRIDDDPASDGVEGHDDALP